MAPAMNVTTRQGSTHLPAQPALCSVWYVRARKVPASFAVERRVVLPWSHGIGGRMAVIKRRNTK